jgi:hypothetical protein
MLPDVMKLLAVGNEEGVQQSVPAAIIALPSSENATFSPAPINPLEEYQPEEGPARRHVWNTGGQDLLKIAVPFGVFLAPREEAAVIRNFSKSNAVRVRCLSFASQHFKETCKPCNSAAHARHASHVDPTADDAVMQRSNGAMYGSSVQLDTRTDLEGNSVACVRAHTCEPMGGYSVWASMPPQNNATRSQRQQILVLSHWDSQGLFRSIISVRTPHHLHSCILCLSTDFDVALCATSKSL